MFIPFLETSLSCNLHNNPEGHFLLQKWNLLDHVCCSKDTTWQLVNIEEFDNNHVLTLCFSL